jgi:hypothetical protein
VSPVRVPKQVLLGEILNFRIKVEIFKKWLKLSKLIATRRWA